MARTSSPPTLARSPQGTCRAYQVFARSSCACLCLGLALLAAPTAFAAEFVVEAGQSWSGRSSLASSHTGFVQVGSDRSFLMLRGRLQARPIAMIGIISGRDTDRYRRNAWLVGTGLRITRSTYGKRHWFWESFLLASPQDTPSLSGHFQFANGFGYAQGDWEVKARHISNAGLRGPNHGETMLLVGYHF